MSLTSRTAFVGSLLAAVIVAGCDKVPLLAPTNTTIRLTSGLGVLPIGGSTEITAIVIESAGTPVQNGTVVTFTSSLGTVEPREARSSNGQVTVRYVAGAQSGSAKIGAFSGGSKSDDLEILVGAAAAAVVSLRADSTVVPSTGGSTDVIATVLDTGGNPLRNAPVNFSTTAGQLAQSTVLTNDAGDARTTLTTNVNAEVTARVGGGATAPTGKITISAKSLPLISITVAGPLGGQANSAEVGQPAIFTVKSETGTDGNAIRSVRIDFGDGTSTTLGALPNTTTVAHVYSRTGAFTVTATATDALGFVGTTSAIITVLDRASIPVSVTATVPLSGGLVTFSANVTIPAGVSIRAYEWDFGDGVVFTTTGITTSHRYTSARTYHVTLRVIATNGQEGFTELDIRVPI
jgi:adhesin/invasin